MQINNNYQPSFKSVAYQSSLKEEIQSVLKKRVKAKDLQTFMDRLEKSPVKATFGLADGTGFDRLDVNLYYKSPAIADSELKEAFSFIEEKKRFNLFNFRPKNFIKRVLSELNAIEESYQIGKYAK